MTRQAWIELVVVRLPIIILMGAWWFLARHWNRQYRGHVDQVNSVNLEIRAANP